MYKFIFYSGNKIFKIANNQVLVSTNLKDYYFNKIKNSYIHEIKNTTNGFKFRGTIFRFAWNGFNFLNGISNGSIKIQVSDNEIVVKYKIFFVETFIIALLFTIFPFLASFKLWLSLSITFIVWGVYYILGSFISLHRFKLFINNGLKEIYKIN